MHQLEPLVIRNANAAALVNDYRILYLLPFVKEAQTVAAAAHELGIPQPTMRRWINRFIEAELLTRTYVGEPATYQIPAPRLQIPVGRLTVEGFMGRYGQEWERFARSVVVESNRHSDEWTVNIFSDEHGQKWLRASPHDSPAVDLTFAPIPGVSNWWIEGHFTAAAIREIQTEIMALHRRCSQLICSQDEGLKYHVHLGLVRAHD